MKQEIIYTLLVGVLLFTGCSQKAPELEGNGDMTDKTVSINEDPYASSNSGGDPEGLNFASNGVDGSADGFRSIFFGFDSFSIVGNMQNQIANNANVARGKSTQKVRIEGNCDEFGTDEYNYALGLKRAKAVKDAMMFQGVPSNQIVIVSYGESNPLSNSDMSKNRRVDLRLIR